LRNKSNIAGIERVSLPAADNLQGTKNEMLYFKSCPKCTNGTLYEHDGIDGQELKCVNCAFVVYDIASLAAATKSDPEISILPATA